MGRLGVWGETGTRGGGRAWRRVSVAGLVAVLATGACKGPGTDPARYLPSDADALAVMRPAADLMVRAAALLDRLPEAAGAADLLRSATGLDLRSEAGTREQGLDPRRSLAVAVRGGAVLVALPVSDSGVASRRLGLRLARLGFVEDRGSAGAIRRFHDVRDSKREALLRVVGDVALVCAGPAGTCRGFETAVPLAADAVSSVMSASMEVGMPDADLSAILRNDALLELARKELGVSLPGGAAGVMLRAAIGDLRLAASLEQGLRVRAVLGPIGDTLHVPGDPLLPPAGVLARADLDLGSLPDGMMKGLWEACGARCRSDGPGDPAAFLRAWDGRATVALLASTSPLPGPVTDVRAFLKRAAVAAAVGVRAPDGASLGLSSASSLASSLGVAALPWAEREPEGLAGSAGDGLEAAAAARGGVVAVAVGRGSEAVARDLAMGRRAGLGGAPPVLASGSLLRLALDPNGLVEALGGLGVEFVRYVVSSVRVAGADVALQEGRLVLDLSVRLR